MLTYNVPYFQEGDVEAFLLALARLNGRVKKVSWPPSRMNEYALTTL
jgi:hypothetical protein